MFWKEAAHGITPLVKEWLYVEVRMVTLIHFRNGSRIGLVDANPDQIETQKNVMGELDCILLKSMLVPQARI